MLVYFAYLILRSSMDEEQKRARIAAVYNIFAFVMLIVFIGVLPRMYDSLHPGNGGNPAFGAYDLDNNMRIVFYPAVLGWILLSLWIANINIRLNKLKDKQ
jgi:heme exporter protein C